MKTCVFLEYAESIPQTSLHHGTERYGANFVYMQMLNTFCYQMQNRMIWFYFLWCKNADDGLVVSNNKNMDFVTAPYSACLWRGALTKVSMGTQGSITHAAENVSHFPKGLPQVTFIVYFLLPMAPILFLTLSHCFIGLQKGRDTLHSLLILQNMVCMHLLIK